MYTFDSSKPQSLTMNTKTLDSSTSNGSVQHDGIAKEPLLLIPGNTRLVLANGDDYIGKLIDGVPEGKGKLTTKTYIYEGGFLHGLFNGYGICTYTNGCIYKGDWRDGLKHGVGVETNVSTSEQYSGMYSMNERDGHGNYTTSTYIYKGNWKNNLYHGQGILRYTNSKYLYAGEFNAGKREGRGREIDTNGDIYDGTFVNDAREGRGTCMYVSDGSEYEGDWKGGKRNGYGVLQLGNRGCSRRDAYVGKFIANLPHGKGKMININGDIYEGMFKDGQKHGAGVCRHADGQTLTGKWKNDKYLS